MLVVTRKVNERLVIGDDIQILVCGWRKGGIKLGIAAPPHVAVHRHEVYAKIQAGKGFEKDLPPSADSTLEQIRKLCLSRNNASVNLGAHQLASDVLKIIGGAE